VLLGASRKKFMGKLLGIADPMGRLNATLGAHVAGVMAGADIIRAHDVAAHREALAIADAVRRHVP
jgi:dihydropteroate synthase